MKYRIREQNELKPSGVEWLGDIPKDWQQKKIKYLFNIGRGRVIAQDELEEDGIYPVYSSQTKNDGVLGYIKTYDFDCKQLTWTTDGANAGTVFLREGKHNCTNVCGTLQQKNDNFILKYLLFALQKVAPSYKRPDTNGAKIMNGEMAEIKVTFPSKIEQQKIANFLDEKSKIFDEAISKKEQLISKLELAKQSLISEVVTGKLKVVEQNSKLQSIKREQNKLKPSGVEWLGDIPKDWQVKKLGYIFSFKNGVNTDSSNYGKGIKFINVKETINTNFIMEKDIEGSVLVSDSIIKENSVRKGDVLFNRTSETIEELALSTVYYDDKVALFGGFVIRGRQITKDLDLDFKRYCFQSIEMRKQIISYGSGSIRKNIAQTNLKNVYLFVPTITEQQKISKYLDEKLIHFDNTIEKTKQSIKKLKEAKEALISQAVTGKIEVL